MPVHKKTDTADYEKQIKKAYQKEYKDLKLEGALEVDILGFFEPAKHESKKTKEKMR